MPKVSTEHAAGQRERIIDAAAALFARRGFARTSMADIVRESSLSMGAVYHYFASKEALILAVVEGRDGPVDGQFPEEGWSQMLLRLTSYVNPSPSARHPRLVAQIWGEAAVSPELATVVRQSHRRLGEQLARLMDDDRELSLSGNTTELSEVALAALVGLSALVAAGLDVDASRFASTLVQTLRGGAAGIRPPTDSAGAAARESLAHPAIIDPEK